MWTRWWRLLICFQKQGYGKRMYRDWGIEVGLRLNYRFCAQRKVIRGWKYLRSLSGKTCSFWIFLHLSKYFKIMNNHEELDRGPPRAPGFKQNGEFTRRRFSASRKSSRIKSSLRLIGASDIPRLGFNGSSTLGKLLCIK